MSLEYAVGCEAETMYKAVVNIDDGVFRIYFKFFWNGDEKMLWIAKTDEGHLATTYHIATVDEVRHTCPEGVWIVRFSRECNPVWLLKREEYYYSPTISKASSKGRHYDMLVEDDTVSCATTPKDAKKAIEWYEKAKKEVKGEMLQLIDVIFFNRKTKEIDYRKEIVAVDVEEAYMLAAQEYGKYDSKVHMRHANCLFSFIGDNKK